MSRILRSIKTDTLNTLDTSSLRIASEALLISDTSSGAGLALETTINGNNTGSDIHFHENSALDSGASIGYDASSNELYIGMRNGSTTTTPYLTVARADGAVSISSALKTAGQEITAASGHITLVDSGSPDTVVIENRTGSLDVTSDQVLLTTNGTREGIEIVPVNITGNSGGSIRFREDVAGLYGMTLQYDGTVNELRLFSTQLGIDTTHMTMARVTGDTTWTGDIRALAGISFDSTTGIDAAGTSLVFTTGSSVRATLDNVGNLDIDGDLTTGDGVYLGDGNVGIYRTNISDCTIKAGGQDVLSAKANGVLINVDVDVDGDISSSGIIVQLDGSSTTPAIRWADDGDLGIYRNAVNEMTLQGLVNVTGDIKATGALTVEDLGNQLTITDSDSPSNDVVLDNQAGALTVACDTFIIEDGSLPALTSDAVATTIDSAVLNIGSASTRIEQDGLDLVLYANNTEALRLDGSAIIAQVQGGLVLGASDTITAADDLIVLNDDTRISGQLFIGSGFSNIFESGNDLVINPVDDVAISGGMTVTDDLGIGTTAPAAELHVNGTTPKIMLSDSTTGQTSSDGAFIGLSSGQTLDIWNRENTDMRFATNGTARMTVEASGDLVVANDLHVNGNITYTGTITDVSDRRAKKRVREYDPSDSSEVVRALKMHRFDKRVNGQDISTDQIGIIAQEAQAIDPMLVKNTDRDFTGADGQEHQDLLTVDQGRLLMHLLAVVKNLQNRIG
jgi:hypothetical protein